MKDCFEELTERVYEKYPKDNDIWLLLQEVIYMKQKVDLNAKKIDALENGFGTIAAEMLKVLREKGGEI